MGLCRVCQLKTYIAQTLFWLIIYCASSTCYPNISFNLNVFLQMYHSCSFLSKSEGTCPYISFNLYVFLQIHILSLLQMFLHSAGLIQVRMIDIFSFHSFLCNNFSASRLSSHFHFLILIEPRLSLMFSNMIYSFS